MVPLGHDGRPQTEQFLQYIEQRRKQERMQEQEQRSLGIPQDHASNHPSSSSRIVPCDDDVLLGQGRKLRSHKGNVALEKLIEKNQEDHEAAPNRFTKTCIVASIVQRVKAMGGRFLRLDETTLEWSIVDDGVAHEKISMRFRNRSRVKRSASTSVSAAQPAIPPQQQLHLLMKDAQRQQEISLLQQQLLQLQQTQLLQGQQIQRQQQQQQQHLLEQLQMQLLVGQQQQREQHLLVRRLEEEIVAEKRDREVRRHLQLQVQQLLLTGTAQSQTTPQVCESTSNETDVTITEPKKKRFRGV